MNKKFFTGILFLLIILFLVSAIYYNKNKASQDIDPRQNAISEEMQRSDTTINVKHQYKDGTHVYVGQVELPTPCHSYNVSGIQREEDLVEIAIEISDPSTDDVCAQVIVQKTFRVSFQGSEDIGVIASINGEIVNLNEFEVSPDKDIDDYQILIKG